MLAKGLAVTMEGVRSHRKRCTFDRAVGIMMLGAERSVFFSLRQSPRKPAQRLESSPSRTEGAMVLGAERLVFIPLRQSPRKPAQRLEASSSCKEEGEP